MTPRSAGYRPFPRYLLRHFRSRSAPGQVSATGNNGVATASYAFPLGSVGGHTITAKFAGDGLYTPSQSVTTVNVVKNTSVLTYTGTLTSSPSKAVTLTAKLTDDLDRPLAGKTVTFILGSQGCSGVTAANGTVSCPISKLNQNPGKYPLSGQFAGDADYTAVAFKGVFSDRQVAPRTS